jgi:hypothetical protein
MVLNNPAWITGILTNSLSVAVTCFFTIKVARLKSRQATASIFYEVGGIFLGLVLTSTSTLLLYVAQSLVQYDLTPASTLFPIGMWMGYFLTSLSLMVLLLETHEEGYFTRVILVGATTVLLMLSGIGLLDYTSFWNGGAILVVFHNGFANTMSTTTAILIGIYGLYKTSSKRLDLLSTQKTPLADVVEKRNRYLLITVAVFIVQFTVPRATPETVLNPVSVKLVGTTLILLLVFFLFSFLRETGSTSSSQSTIEIVQDDAEAGRLSRFIIFGICSVLLYVFLMQLNIPILTVHEKLESGIPILILGEFKGGLLVADILGFLLPCLISVAIILVVVVKHRTCFPTLKRSYSLMILAFALSLGFSLLASTTAITPNIGESPRVDIMAFIFAPAISLILIALLNQRTASTRFIHVEVEIKSIGWIVLFFFPTIYFSALIFDLIVAAAPFGVIHLGGAGILDGLLWAPILASAIFLSLSGIIHNLRL